MGSCPRLVLRSNPAWVWFMIRDEGEARVFSAGIQAEVILLPARSFPARV
ncbi:MAG: hypothetical protein WBM17_17340 [Anaerolineales bacterium]